MRTFPFTSNISLAANTEDLISCTILPMHAHGVTGKKGPNIATTLTENGPILPLFHPRNDKWEEHFEIQDGMIIGLTDMGRGTVELL